jgi:hypothetical protein
MVHSRYPGRKMKAGAFCGVLALVFVATVVVTPVLDLGAPIARSASHPHFAAPLSASASLVSITGPTVASTGVPSGASSGPIVGGHEANRASAPAATLPASAPGVGGTPSIVVGYPDMMHMGPGRCVMHAKMAPLSQAAQ